jgi:hypothetical protein
MAAGPAGPATAPGPRPGPRGGLVTIGVSIALIIIGAILRFAIKWTSSYVSIQAIGVILMIGGIVGLGIRLSMMFMRRRSQLAAEEPDERRYIEPPS